METDIIPSQRLNYPVLLVPKLKVDIHEKNSSGTFISGKGGKVVDFHLKCDGEESSRDEFIESILIGKTEIKKEELDHKESNLCLEEYSYNKWETRTFKNIQVEYNDRNIGRSFDNDVMELRAIKKETNDDEIKAEELLNDSQQSDLKSEIIEDEEVPIKCEEVDGDKLNSEKVLKSGKKVVLHQCPECPYSSYHKNRLKAHSIQHKKRDEVNWYSCQECPYKTYRKGSLKRHSEIHKSKDEKKKIKKKKKTRKPRQPGNQLVLHQCPECPYNTIYEYHLEAHSIKHKSEDEIDWYNCKECPYKTFRKSDLKIHAEAHNNLLLKCLKCSYVTSRSTKMKRHQIEHDPNIQWMHCPECSFKTRVRSYFQKHSLTHNSFKCPNCPYQSRTRQQLVVHQVKHDSMDDKRYSYVLCPLKTHQKNSSFKERTRRRHNVDPINPNQIVIFKCAECSYENACKSNMRRHQLIHDQSNWYQCPGCSYKTPYKSLFKNHKVWHQGKDGEGWHRCLECLYKSISHSELQRHVITHKSAEEVQWFGCSQCRFKTAYKNNLKRHELKHKEGQEIQWFCCYDCSFKTKYKSYLVKHVSKHKKQINKGHLQDCGK